MALCFSLWYVFPILSWLTVNHTWCSHYFLEWVFLALVCLDLLCSLPIPAMAPRSTPTSPTSFLPGQLPLLSLSLHVGPPQGPVVISILFFLYELALGYHDYNDDLCYHLGMHESQTFYSLCHLHTWVHLHFSYKQLNVSLGCVENLFYFVSAVDLHISSFISTVLFPLFSGLDLYFFQFIDIVTCSTV